MTPPKRTKHQDYAPCPQGRDPERSLCRAGELRLYDSDAETRRQAARRASVFLLPDLLQDADAQVIVMAWDRAVSVRRIVAGRLSGEQGQGLLKRQGGIDA
ncbi:MAG: hypothetical protein WC722_14955 [Rhodospirillales bacterium]|jgi:hypothetical protein